MELDPPVHGPCAHFANFRSAVPSGDFLLFLGVGSNPTTHAESGCAASSLGPLRPLAQPLKITKTYMFFFF